MKKKLNHEEKQRTVLIAAGGSGGHVFPAQALAQELCNQGWKVSFVLESRGSQWKGFDKRLKLYKIQTGYFGQGNPLKKALNLCLLFVGFCQSLFHIYRLRPHVVIGFGGYPSLPVLLASLFYRTKRIIHEQNAVLGRVNRWMHPFVHKAALSIPLVRPYSKTELTGLPVRSQILKARTHPYPEMKESFIITVLGGSQGARIFSEELPPVFKALMQEKCPTLEIIQQCRKEFLLKTQKAYAKVGLTAQITPFIENISEVLVKSHLVISRAGASSIAELTTVGRPSILVPYPHAMDDHQTANALHIQRAGAAWILNEEDLKKGKLLSLLRDLFRHPNKLKNAAGCAKAIGSIDAIGKIIRLMDI